MSVLCPVARFYCVVNGVLFRLQCLFSGMYILAVSGCEGWAKMPMFTMFTVSCPTFVDGAFQDILDPSASIIFWSVGNLSRNRQTSLPLDDAVPFLLVLLRNFFTSSADSPAWLENHDRSGDLRTTFG